ncbi:MAG: PDZ domain-containing protein [Planctomycetota bacterium]|jgi:hypothetical protein|nr:PDZ domain-containing protein [Planctomycetota bacterium]
MLRHLAPLALICLSVCALQAADTGYYDDDFFDPVGIQPEEVPPEQPAQEPQTPMLGGQFTPPPRRVQQREGLAPDEGVYVFKVYPDTAADDLGIQPGDVILQINDQPVGSLTELREAVFGQGVGDEAKVIVTRNGETLNLGGATFQPWPEDIPMQRIDAEAERRYRERQMSRLDRNMNDLTELDAQQDGLGQELAAGEAKRAALDQAFERAAAIAAATGNEPMLPLAILALPAWRFDYDVAVANPADGTIVPITVPLHPVSALAPSFDIELAIRASSEAL